MKKKKRSAPQPAKPGIARQYLLDNYSQIPENRDLQNGHVLHIFLENKKSVAETIRACHSVLTDTCSMMPNYLTALTKKFQSFQNLGRETEKERFVELCGQTFMEKEPPPQIPMEVMPVVDIPESELGQSEPGPSNASAPNSSMFDVSFTPHSTLPERSPFNTPVPESPSAMSTPISQSRKAFLTPTKRKMKKRLDFIAQMRSVEKRKYRRRMKDLKDKINIGKVNQIKYLNQDISRKKHSMKVKEATIALLKKQVRKAKVGANQTDNTKKGPTLKTLIRNHQRLKASKKNLKKQQNGKIEDKVLNLKKELEGKAEIIRNLENRILELEENLRELECAKTAEKPTKKDGKTYSPAIRMLVYDAIVNQVPTKNIPALIQSQAERTGENLSAIPQRSTVEQMARELDVIADLKVAETAMKTKNLTIGFDATTQEGTHINSIHLTTKEQCEVVAIDELPGGTGNDYHDHVTESVDNLANVYSDFHKDEYQHCRSTIIGNISNSMTDRVAVNHVSIRKINETWGKELNELNCHLHPLDTIASTCRSTLKHLESTRGHLYGKDCIAGNLVLQINKFRFKDGKGDPKGFKVFLNKENLPLGLLHVLFHICGKFIEHHNSLLEFFTTGTVSCGGLQTSIKKDFENPVGILEIQVLGLLGKLLTGPWMQVFYTAADTELNHFEGFRVVQEVISTLKAVSADPLSTLSQDTDFFGRKLSATDSTLAKLRILQGCQEDFSEMMKACLGAVVTVLERQYKRYFGINVTSELQEETATARLHNIDAEEVMGMFSAGKERSKNACIDFLRAKMKAKKNRIVPYLDSLYKDERDSIVNWAVSRARKKRIASRKKQDEIRKELSRRAALKTQKKAETERKEIEHKLKALDVGDIETVFPELDESTKFELEGILSGTVVGKKIMHTWYDTDNNEKTLYSGKLEKMKKKNGVKYFYTVAYWHPDQNETYDEDAVDTPMSKFELGADLIGGDLVFC